MSYVPLPVRVAVGLMVTAVEQARKLPEQLIELPVAAASRAVQTGMRVHQRVTELAIKGDQVFALLRPVEDTPPWATFDEDGEPPQPGAGPTASDSQAAEDGAGTAPADHAVPHSRADDVGAREAVVTPALLAEYDEMSLAQLRARLRKLSLSQLVGLREHERAHLDRPAFITMLSNRIVTVSGR